MPVKPRRTAAPAASGNRARGERGSQRRRFSFESKPQLGEGRGRQIFQAGAAAQGSAAIGLDRVMLAGKSYRTDLPGLSQAQRGTRYTPCQFASMPGTWQHMAGQGNHPKVKHLNEWEH
jgi:hypothetical protein